MAKAKLAVTLNQNTLSEVDRLVKGRVFPNRSRLIEEAVTEKIARLRRDRLARECARLDPQTEKLLADEGIGEDLAQWPEY